VFYKLICTINEMIVDFTHYHYFCPTQWKVETMIYSMILQTKFIITYYFAKSINKQWSMVSNLNINMMQVPT